MIGFRFQFCLPLICLLLSACAEPTAPPNPGAMQPDKALPDLSTPILEPKPLVWVQDWGGEAKVPAARQEAARLLRKGDAMKSSEAYAEAEKVYRAVIQADPSWAYPHYQLACNYELWNKHEQAVSEFKTSMELGLDDFPMMMSDPELGSIRQRPDFVESLQETRRRYLASSHTRVGQPIAVRPEGTPPTGGWPLMLLLHGYGDSNVNYLDQAQAWAAQGFVAVAVPGTVPMTSDSFQWSKESVDPTQRDLQAIVKSPLLEGLINPQQVFLMGFSQGALHSLILTMQRPDQYAGVVALSPGGSLAEQIMEPVLTQHSRCVFIYGQLEPHAPVAAKWRAACKKAGWEYLCRIHQGSHHFPEDWDEVLPKIANFLKSEK